MATKINIKNIPEGFQSLINNEKHSVLGDEPKSSGGTDLGFSPVEFLLAGISMCKVATIRNTARKKGWEIGTVDAEVYQTVMKQDDGSFTTRVDSAIRIEGELTTAQKELLITEADNCYVTRVVSGDWEFTASEELKTLKSK